MPRQVAMFPLVLLLAASAVHAAYPTTPCVGSESPNNEIPLGTYETKSAEVYAANILGEAADYMTLTSASLYGPAALSGQVDYCQGDIYNNLIADGKDPLVVVFTTGNGSLPAYTPVPGDVEGGFQNENDSKNDRYTGDSNGPGATGPSSEFGVSCRGANGQTFNAYDSSGIKFTTEVKATGTIQIPFMFASDEYPEYAGPAQLYKDQMRIFVRVNGGAYTNVALVNGQPVGIDTVNSNVNADKFFDNDPNKPQINDQTKYATQYDGFTSVLKTVPFAVKAGDVLDVAIVVDDCNDRQLDSAIMVQAGAFFSLKPQCSGFTFSPEPSYVGAEVEVTASFTDEPGSDITSISCTTADNKVYSCTGSDITVSGNTASCSFTHTMTAGDFSTGITCTATDSTQTSECTGKPTLAPPSPSPTLPPSPVPVPSPVLAPSPVIVTPLPSPVPTPSPASTCEAPARSPVPPAPCPEGAPDCNPLVTNCVLYNPEGGVINGPVAYTCSQCQWECLTNQYCASAQFYNNTEPIPANELPSYNCGDGGYTDENSQFKPLCVLVGPNGQYPFPDTQNQPCFNCKEQCLTWEECTGVWYQYQWYPKESLATELCC